MDDVLWHLEHRDGSLWTPDELTEIVRIEREHDDAWPYDAHAFAVTIGMDSAVYVLDNCMAWHRMDDVREGEDARVVFE